MFNLFKKFNSGALLDTRSIEDKNKDYEFRELVSSVNPVNWVEKTEYRKFPIYNQDGSGSCVAQTMAKLLGIMYWLKNGQYVHFSATDIYQRRSNIPHSGMGGVDTFDIARKGTTLEELVPSQNMTDEQMDGIKIPQYKRDVGSVFKIGNYITAPITDIETVASIIQTTGKGVMVWFFFNQNEWTNVPEVKDYYLIVDKGSRHSVAAVDFTLYKNKKALIIEDSWGTSYGLAGQRIITEDFFKVRNWFTAYPMTFKFDEVNIKPSFVFNKNLSIGMSNLDVKNLQDCLKYEGVFPTNTESTGYFGIISAKALYNWQVKHNVDSLEMLNQLQGRIFGPKSRIKMNEIYG